MSNPLSSAAAQAAAPAPAFILDPILPTRSVNLLGGRSGSGKTTLLLQMLEDWEAGREVFGATPYPAPWCYVACAKPHPTILHTARSIGINFRSPKPPVISLTKDRLVNGEELTPEYALKLARLAVPDLRLLVLDGIGRLCAAGGKRVTEYNVVAEFMAGMISLAQREHITIIGVGPVAKSAAGAATRDMFLGSVAWAEFAHTMISIESSEPKDPSSPARTVTIHSPNCPTQILQYMFDTSGRLVTLNKDTSLERMMLEGKIESECPPGMKFDTAHAELWAKEVGVGRSLLFLWLKEMIAAGRLEKDKHGVYVVKHKV